MNTKGLEPRAIGGTASGRQHGEQGLTLTETLLSIVTGVLLLGVTIGIADWVKNRDRLRENLDTIHLIAQHVYDTHGWSHGCGATPCGGAALAAICARTLSGLPPSLRPRLRCGASGGGARQWVLEFQADRSYRIGLARRDGRPFTATQCVHYARALSGSLWATLQFGGGGIITPANDAEICEREAAGANGGERLWVTLRW